MEKSLTELRSKEFTALSELRDREWNKIIKNSKWCNFILNGEYDRRFYAIYLIETYHYVQHNPKHQALVATRFESMPSNYMKFCYEHAEEEAGHEMMAFHDLSNLGVTQDQDETNMPLPLSSTETFIGYLYRISKVGNPLRRLGYSFWAEDSYQYIQTLMQSVIEKLELNNKHTTFLVSHAAIDEDHAAEIENMIQKYCKTEDDWSSVQDVLITSLKLQSEMLDDIVEEYLKLQSDSSTRYSHLINQ
ncbi:iron-containing redox enzyme family protein [Pedobacter endophyticus]|uniref:Iron-containing redox enzyme family protein n=1 Tax=Pedobacter endophyticus TaxID=2789740 RepID=A0A7U3Q476_9SPHI|nr:iron-containing redox enzyme family protein [Pedobacter endophyticus]QPH38262.1 iron-containing redox enzyme family protein [Pedobacter endophyticus]